MTKRRGKARRRQQRRRATIFAAAVALVTVAVLGAKIWLVLLIVALASGFGTAGWWGWRTHRALREKDRRWREEQRVLENHHSLAEVDTLPGEAFEQLVAALCRRDGCTEVERVGRTGDDGADVIGRLPDGRTMVIQCKRYAPHRAIGSPDMRGLLGSRTHFGADVALFVTTARITRKAEEFAVTNGIIALHRDLFASWHSGAPLTSIAQVNGSGQGNRQHQQRWKGTYSPRKRTRRPRPRDT
ncbi:restriction endonuclease [Streptomyces radicis]|uniref:Restriction endonuclease n=1 Tax=Streptomyces radicis TaxID=1750517 RepID=A0A3A9WZD0_9ACTN|nr:restriction endonuclease [Streptomyces radicis]RKN11567.1 restriction endonuclease [Streptomyces radicis]RKN26415.1 restriction endonuclease [Streptomyces radicis]